MSRSPSLIADDATRRKYRDVTKRTVGRWMVGVDEV
jgi:hypothetical protein